MTSTNKILGGLLIVALIYIALMQGCGGGWGNGSVIVKSDTVRIETIRVDTIRVPVEKLVTKTIFVKVPVPYIDTTSDLAIRELTIDDFDDLVHERPMIYQDTVSDDTIAIHYRIRTWGFVDKIELGYTIKNQYYIKERQVIETQITNTTARRFNGFYLGMDVGIIKDSLSHVTPVLEASFRRFNYNIGFDLMDKDIIVGAKFKLGK